MNDNSLILAENSGESYSWYPDIHDQEEMLSKKRALDESPSVAYTTIFNLEGDGHIEDFNTWKNALTYRTMTFKKPGFTFYGDNIKLLSPEGFILHVRK